MHGNLMDVSSNHAFGLKVQFLTYFLGKVDDLAEPPQKRVSDVTLIDLIEEAQLCGKLNLCAQENDSVIVYVSRHGIKVLDPSGQVVLMRHPLHTIAQTLYYDDGFGRSNIVVKIGQVRKTVFEAFVFQSKSSEQAREICSSLKRIFDVVSEKV